MTYSGGLDGLRGVAVVVVVLFHAQVPFATGGFLGVSLFFTLSGFLITSLLLAEFDANSTISLRHFYLRRARRLLPAAYACLLLVALLSAWWTAGQLDDLPGDLVAAVANVANWRFAFAPTSYADLFLGAPSPVAHFWSLAIEEQIYLVLPVVVLVALRRGRRTLGWVTALMLAGSVAATLATSDRDLVYNGTHTRAAELLVGVALALALGRRGGELRSVSWRRVPWLPGAVAGMAFLLLVAAASVDQEWIYRGGLPAVSVVSAVLIAAVVSQQFPNRLLDVAALVALGRLSYGIYLFHWPIFLLLDAERTGLDPVPLFVVRCVVTVFVAVASARLLERPIRLGHRPRTTRRFVAVTAAGALAVLAAAVMVPPPEYTRTEELLTLGEADIIDFRTTAPTGTVTELTTVSQPVIDEPPESPFLVAVIGSEPSAVEAARAAVPASGPGVAIDVIADVRPECPLSTTGLPGCDAPVDRLRALTAGAGLAEVGAVVIATGPAEDAEIAPRSEAARSGEQLAELARSQLEASAAIREVIDLAATEGARVMLYSTGQRYGAFDDQLVHIAIGDPSLGDVIRTGDGLSSEVLSTVRAHRSAGAEDASDTSPLRVIVIGDSTSLSMAMALNDGGDGRLEVLWAGANGCPLAPVDATRTSHDDDWSSHDCEPYEGKLAPLVASFAPDVVLVVSGPTELTEHRFPGDPEAHVAGDPAFVAARERTIDAIADAVPGVPILVADVPAVTPGGFASREMAAPERLDALNDQIEQWDRRSEQIAVFPYRGVLETAEASHGSLRTDGVHADAAPLETLARSVFVDLLVEMTDRMRTGLTAAGSNGS